MRGFNRYTPPSRETDGQKKARLAEYRKADRELAAWDKAHPPKPPIKYETPDDWADLLDNFYGGDA